MGLNFHRWVCRPPVKSAYFEIDRKLWWLHMPTCIFWFWSIGLIILSKPPFVPIHMHLLPLADCAFVQADLRIFGWPMWKVPILFLNMSYFTCFNFGIIISAFCLIWSTIFCRSLMSICKINDHTSIYYMYIVIYWYQCADPVNSFRGFLCFSNQRISQRAILTSLKKQLDWTKGSIDSRGGHTNTRKLIVTFVIFQKAPDQCPPLDPRIESSFCLKFKMK